MPHWTWVSVPYEYEGWGALGQVFVQTGAALGKKHDALLVMKSTNWSKFLDPVHIVVSAIELSVYASTLRTHQGRERMR